MNLASEKQTSTWSIAGAAAIAAAFHAFLHLSTRVLARACA